MCLNIYICTLYKIISLQENTRVIHNREHIPTTDVTQERYYQGNRGVVKDTYTVFAWMKQMGSTGIATNQSGPFFWGGGGRGAALKFTKCVMLPQVFKICPDKNLLF